MDTAIRGDSHHAVEDGLYRQPPAAPDDMALPEFQAGTILALPLRPALTSTAPYGGRRPPGDLPGSLSSRTVLMARMGG